MPQIMREATHPRPDRTDDDVSLETDAAPRLRPCTVETDGSVGAETADWPSPALLMQRRLAERIEADEPEDRWPWRLTVAFVMVSCSAFWITLYAFLRVLIG